MKNKLLFRDPDELVKFHNAGCFSGNNKSLYLPAMVDVVLHLYDGKGHPILELVQKKMVFVISSTYSQLEIINQWEADYAINLCYEDCAVLYHASVTTCLFVSSEGILIDTAKGIGINVMNTMDAFEMIITN